MINYKKIYQKEVISLSAKMRLGLGMLMPREGGFVELPKKAENLCCPQCGTLLGNKGQCSAQFIERPRADQVNVVKIIVDCRSCGCINKEPMFKNTFELLREKKEQAT
jgi:RNase P subunit RPR2